MLVMQVREIGESECHFVMKWIGYENDLTRKGADFQLVFHRKMNSNSFKGYWF